MHTYITCIYSVFAEVLISRKIACFLLQFLPSVYIQCCIFIIVLGMPRSRCGRERGIFLINLKEPPGEEG